MALICGNPGPARVLVNAPLGVFSATHLFGDRLGSDIVSFVPDLGSQAQVPLHVPSGQPCLLLVSVLSFFVDKYFLLKQLLFIF